MTRIFALVALLSIAACGKKAEYADVDCGKLMDHMIDVTVSGVEAAQQGVTRERMTKARAHLIEACEQEKPTKKMTVAQYDCVMKAPSMPEFQKCMQ